MMDEVKASSAYYEFSSTSSPTNIIPNEQEEEEVEDIKPFLPLALDLQEIEGNPQEPSSSCSIENDPLAPGQEQLNDGQQLADSCTTTTITNSTPLSNYNKRTAGQPSKSSKIKLDCTLRKKVKLCLQRVNCLVNEDSVTVTCDRCSSQFTSLLKFLQHLNHKLAVHFGDFDNNNKKKPTKKRSRQNQGQGVDPLVNKSKSRSKKRKKTEGQLENEGSSHFPQGEENFFHDDDDNFDTFGQDFSPENENDDDEFFAQVSIPDLKTKSRKKVKKSKESHDEVKVRSPSKSEPLNLVTNSKSVSMSECHLCDKSYRKARDLNRHLQLFHHVTSPGPSQGQGQTEVTDKNSANVDMDDGHDDEDQDNDDDYEPEPEPRSPDDPKQFDPDDEDDPDDDHDDDDKVKTSDSDYSEGDNDVLKKKNERTKKDPNPKKKSRTKGQGQGRPRGRPWNGKKSGPAACDVCGTVFPNNNRLKVHLISHSSATPFPCTEPGCTRAFKRQGELNRHMAIHRNNEKTKLCPVCGKCFRTNGDLNLHMRIHGEKKLRCSDCDYVTNLKYAFEQHRLNKHLGVTYTCEMCGLGYKSKMALKYHIHSHTGEKPIKCKVPGCDYACAHPQNLRKHQRNNHRPGGLKKPGRKKKNFDPSQLDPPPVESSPNFAYSDAPSNSSHSYSYSMQNDGARSEFY